MGIRVQSLRRHEHPAGLVAAVPAARGTLGRQVFDHLRLKLIGGQLVPGERLSLRALAEALGVSMMPVRDAVSRLVADGALAVLPNRAVRVPVMTLAEFRELTRIRILVEGFAAAEAARAIPQAALKRLRAHEQLFRRESEAAQPNPARAVEENRRLHFALYAAAGMPQLVAIIEGLWLRAGPVLNLDMRDEPRRLRRGTAVQCHALLVDALARRDAAGARAAIAGDIVAAAQHIEELGQLAGTEDDARREEMTDGSWDRRAARARHRGRQRHRA